MHYERSVKDSRMGIFDSIYLFNDVGTELLFGKQDHFALELQTKWTSEVREIEVH